MTRMHKLILASIIFLVVILMYWKTPWLEVNSIRRIPKKYDFKRRNEKAPISQVPVKVEYPNVGKLCGANTKRELLATMLRYWHRFTQRAGIEYAIMYGSLLGQYRNKDLIPWDRDLDVVVDARSFKVLQKFSDERNFTPGQDKRFRIVVQPDFETKAENDRQRWSCDGKEVQMKVDQCSFITPMARLLYGKNRVDIFAIQPVHTLENKLFIPDSPKLQERTEFYPFVKCTFMDEQTWCPNNPKAVLKKLYENIEPEYECRNGQWVLAKHPSPTPS